MNFPHERHTLSPAFLDIPYGTTLDKVYTGDISVPTSQPSSKSCTEILGYEGPDLVQCLLSVILATAATSWKV